MKENGFKINSMDKELSIGLMVQSTREHFNKERNKVSEYMFSKMAHVTMVKSPIIHYMAKVKYHLKMVSLMRVIGKITKWMELVNSHGVMGEYIKANTKKVESMAKAKCYGQMANYIREGGLMENNMDKVNIKYLSLRRNKANGNMVN